MSAFVQVKAAIPRDLKRRAFAALALREEKFNRWLQRELEEFLQKLDEREKEGSDEHLPVPTPQDAELHTEAAEEGTHV